MSKEFSNPESERKGRTPPKSGQAKRVRVVEEIIETLRKDIVTRNMPPGDQLPNEKALSERFGVSQPTIREAIRVLETMGLVEVFHGSGSYVSSHAGYGLAAALQTLLQLESVGILEVLNVRQILGRESVEMAAQSASRMQVEHIENALHTLDNLDDAESVNDVIERIIEFQRKVSEAAGNPLLQAFEIFLSTLLIRIQTIALKDSELDFWKRRANEFQADRRAIFEAIRDKSSEKARTAIDQYLEDQRDRFAKDASLRSLNLSDPRWMPTITEIVRSYRL